MKSDIFTYMVAMPSKIKAITVLSGLDEYTVYINAALSAEAQQEAFQHELEHIRNKDYDHFYDVNVLEHFRND